LRIRLRKRKIKCSYCGWGCGCEARFFEFSTKDLKYHDVTKDCRDKNFTELSFASVTFTQEDAEAIAKDPAATRKVFRLLNSLTSEALSALASYMKQMAEINPTDKNINNYKMAVEKLKALLKEGQMHDTFGSDKTSTNEGEEKGSATGIILDIAKPFLQKLAAHQSASDKEVLIMDEQTGQTISVSDTEPQSVSDSNFAQLVNAIVKVFPKLKDIGSRLVEAIKNQEGSKDEGDESFMEDPIKNTLNVAEELGNLNGGLNLSTTRRIVHREGF